MAEQVTKSASPSTNSAASKRKGNTASNVISPNGGGSYQSTPKRTPSRRNQKRRKKGENTTENNINKSSEKQTTYKSPEATKCVCGKPECTDQMKRLSKLKPELCVYFNVPRPPKTNPNRKSKLRAEEKANKVDQQRRYECFIDALGEDAKNRVELYFNPDKNANDRDKYSRTSEAKFASIHVHPEIMKLIPTNSKRELPKSIPRSMGLKLSNEGLCQFRDKDVVPSSSTRDFFPLPNWTIERATEFITQLENEVKSRDLISNIEVPRVTRSRSAINRDPQLFEIERLHGEVDEKMKLIAARENELAEKEKKFNQSVSRMNKLLMERERALLSREKELAKKLKHLTKVLSGGIGGLSRFTLQSKKWHLNNKEASTALFGFTSWKETVLYIHALFDLYPPLVEPKAGDEITDFEWCLAAKMRMNCGMPYRTIAFILGLKSESHCGKGVKPWIFEWGEAGEDISILDITPEFLDSTCPQAYKDEKLDKICGIPDGKDFKIFTPRKNTLFTRACYSDKVHASAVRCISWCTPMGLSYEHTNLFLARVSEKSLVELWGPRMKKCPKGYGMLSDRGFWDTARCYPNMNRQLTPKFLSGRKQFTAEEVSADRTICKLRYTCEVAFSRVTDTGGLKDVISLNK